jgi:predicted chitinase
MIKLKYILEQRGNEQPLNILFITDYDVNKNWHVFRRLTRSRNITGTFKSYTNEDSSEMVNLLHYNITNKYDFVIVQLSNLKDTNVNAAIQNYKRAIRICKEVDVPLIIIAPPYPKFSKDLDATKNLMYFERIDAWLHSVETSDVMMVDLSELDDDAYFTRNGVDLNKIGNDVIYQDLLQLIDTYEQTAEPEPVIEPEEEPEEEPQEEPIISLKQLMFGGHVEIVGSVDTEQESNIKLIIQYMNDSGITNPYTQIGILSVIGKESNYIPQSEVSYRNTSNSRIREIFGNRVPADDEELNALKADDEAFFNQVYGGRFGNAEDEGYLYRGRGFNQLTFKDNYKAYGNAIGKDLVSDPDKLNNEDVAAAVAVKFFTKRKSANSLPNFTNVNDAVTYFTNINAGGKADARNHGSAQQMSKLFKVVS